MALRPEGNGVKDLLPMKKCHGLYPSLRQVIKPFGLIALKDDMGAEGTGPINKKDKHRGPTQLNHLSDDSRSLPHLWLPGPRSRSVS